MKVRFWRKAGWRSTSIDKLPMVPDSVGKHKFLFVYAVPILNLGLVGFKDGPQERNF
jgi:hypothetical protein